jgi:hypothetical protein
MVHRPNAIEYVVVTGLGGPFSGMGLVMQKLEKHYKKE